MSENDGSYSEQNATGALGDILGQYPTLHSTRPMRWVYFVQVGEEGPIKIGVAGKVDNRVNAIQTSNYQDIRLIGMTPGDEEDERRWHDRFAKHSISGEWFSPHPDLLDAIDEINGVNNKGTSRGDPLLVEVARMLVTARALDGRWHSCLNLARDIISKARG